MKLTNILTRAAVVLSALCAVNSHASEDLLPGLDLVESDLSILMATTVEGGDGQGGTVVIDQFGIFNVAGVFQTGDSSNETLISQSGQYNVAGVVQIGVNNYASIVQIGDENYAEVIQEGNNNFADIVQEGEQEFIVHQIGNDMEVIITQSAP